MTLGRVWQVGWTSTRPHPPKRMDALSLRIVGCDGLQEEKLRAMAHPLLGGANLCVGTVMLEDWTLNWSELEGTLDTGSPGSYLAKEEG